MPDTLDLRHIPHSPAQHLRLALYAAAARIVEQACRPDAEAAMAAFPVLAETREQLQAHTGLHNGVAARGAAGSGCATAESGAAVAAAAAAAVGAGTPAAVPQGASARTSLPAPSPAPSTAPSTAPAPAPSSGPSSAPSPTPAPGASPTSVPAQAWVDALPAWEAASPVRLPLAALRQAGCSPLALELLAAAALLDEDPRFGDVFEHAQGRGRRPSLALLVAWWREGPGLTDRSDAVRQAVLGLVQGGLLQVSNPEAPRSEWQLHLPHLLLDALRGEAPSTVPGLQLRPHATLPALHQLVLPQALRDTADALPALLRQGPGTVLLLRGAPHNSRRTLLGGVAQALGAGLLLADSSWCEDPSRWRLLGLLALLLDAMPALHADLAAGQTRTLPPLPWAHHPLGVATSRQGAWATDTGAPLGVDLPLPDPAERQRHWQAALPTLEGPAAQALALAARLGRGSIHRAAPAAAVRARLAGHPAVQPADLRAACRSLQAARLQTLATWLPAQGGLADLAVDTPTRDEIHALAARCRHREALAAATPALAQGNAGVRALLAGASGTGKTLAARLLAAELGKDLYRVDLAATVNKYLGETEKNLDAAFAAAEELDVVLLLDEGDALMAGRTDVGSSNDRYANLETNFLLQRIESFDGILLVTSNAADRIDKAFARRMDVVIHFRPPDEWRRLEILRSHLAAERGADPTAAAEPGPLLDDDWLQQMACRCALSGGQWRNVAGHARLLALQEGTALHTGHLDAALRREYRKTGASCPLRPWAGAATMQPAA